MKIKNLYNLESYKKFLDSHKAKGFKDAASGIVLERNLTAVDPKIFEKQYPELAFMNSGIEINNTGGYADRIESLRIIGQGDFTNSGDSTTTKGLISLKGEKSYLNVIQREAHSKWDDTEINQASLQNINLVEDLMNETNKLYMRNMDLIGFTGIPDVATSTGLLNYGSFTSGAAGGAIGTLTAQQKYDEIKDLIIAQRNAVNNTPGYTANKVIMPISIRNDLDATMMDTASGNKTVMFALQQNFPDVSFSATFRAESVSATSVVIAFSSSEEVMKMRVPQPLTIGEIVRNGSFDYQVDSKYRIAGLDILEDAGGRILTGL